MSIRESSLPKKDRKGDSDRWRPTGGHTKQVRERDEMITYLLRRVEEREGGERCRALLLDDGRGDRIDFS